MDRTFRDMACVYLMMENPEGGELFDLLYKVTWKGWVVLVECEGG